MMETVSFAAQLRVECGTESHNVELVLVHFVAYRDDPSLCLQDETVNGGSCCSVDDGDGRSGGGSGVVEGRSSDGGGNMHKMRTSSASKMRMSLEVATAAMAAAVAAVVAEVATEVVAEVEWWRADVAVMEVVRHTR